MSYNGGHGGCQPVKPRDTPDGPTVFVQEGPILPDAYVPPRPWKTGGTGRFRLRGPSDDAGDMAPLAAWLLFRSIDSVVLNGNTARFLDTVTQKDCNPVRTPDGPLRCATSIESAEKPKAIYSLGADQSCARISDGEFAVSLGGAPVSWDQYPLLPERNAPPPEAR